MYIYRAITTDPFYCFLLECVKAKVWYTSVPVGRNKFHKMVSTKCKEASISGEKTTILVVKKQS